MAQTPNNRATDLRGIGNLTTDAIIGITNLVEAVHYTITNYDGIPGDATPKRTRGIPGLVYRNIRAVTGLAGGGADILLAQFGLLLGENNSSPGREAALAVLNGVLGDHLVARKNPLALTMQFRQQGIPMTPQMFSESVQQSKGKVAIMVHGSCMNDLQWNRQGHDHGAALARDLGFAPVYLHYNTGRHISENGRAFASLLESFAAETSEPLEIVIIGHSMGGLVARSACHYGSLAGYSWLNSLQKLIFLGTPHHGAPLEKGGNWIDGLLDFNPYSAPFSRLGKIRSSGLTDLRFGNVVDEDWYGQDRFKVNGDKRTPVPLPEGVACYAIAASTSKELSLRGEDLIGDGLVKVSSALGHHEKGDLALSFPETHQWVGQDMNHLALLNHPDVYDVIKKWVAA